MLENRSFDNLVGWLYWKDGNRPPINIPPKAIPTYDGLAPGMWNPDSKGNKVPVTYGTSGTNLWNVPSPDPQELFDHMNYQLFGTQTPPVGAAPTMMGFVQDYATVKGNSNPNAIMECYSPEQTKVLSTLARNYAICDRWFASAPCQTWPNRAFVHAGTSCGRVNNCNNNEDDCVPDPLYYDTRTIFNFLQDIGKGWKVYNDSWLMSLTRAQFIEHLGDPFWEGHFKSFSDFVKDAKAGTLPAYSFVEPSFLKALPTDAPPNDEHPPHDVRLGEKFLYDIWVAVSTGKRWNETLLVITYDEHGGIFDHTKPPNTAVRPDNSKPQEPFDFRRYGVRVPTVVVSPYIEAGTVFRSASASVEYDHTSILATLRDWVDPTGKYSSKFLASARIKAAPKLDMLLTRATPRKDVPVIQPTAVPSVDTTPLDTPLNSMQKAVIAATVAQKRGVKPGDAAIRSEVYEQLKTVADAQRYLAAMR